MSTWKTGLHTTPTRVWIVLSFVLGLGVGLAVGIGWVISGMVFGLLLGLVLGAGLVSTLQSRSHQRREAARAGGLIRFASSLQAGDTRSVIEALEADFNSKLAVSVWNRDVARLPEAILENWQCAKVYYDKYRPAGEKIPSETYNILTYLERVPWPAREAARREFAATYQAGPPQLAPELAREDVQAWLNTDPITLQELRGKAVLLDFWATPCRPCVAALPDVQKLFGVYLERGLIVIGITSGESEARIRAFLDRHHVTFPVCLARGSNLWHKYAIEGIPTYFLIDRSGLLVWGPSHGLPDEPRILGLL